VAIATAAPSQSPVTETGDGQRYGDDEADDGLDRSEQSLAGKVHLAVIDPQRRLQGVGDERGQHHQPQHHQHPVPVDERDQRQRRHHGHERRGGHDQLERERTLERGFLVGLVLLDVLVADPHVLEPREDAERDHQYAPDPIDGRGEQGRQDDPSGQPEQRQADVEGTIEEDPAGRKGPQRGASGVDAPACCWDRLRGARSERAAGILRRVQHLGKHVKLAWAYSIGAERC